MEIYLLSAVLVVSIIILVLQFRRRQLSLSSDLQVRLEAIDRNLQQLGNAMREDARINRSELGNMMDRFQQTFLDTLKVIQGQQQEQLAAISGHQQEQLGAMSKQQKEQLADITDSNRNELTKNMNNFQQAFDRNVESFNNLQKEKFRNLELKQGELVADTAKKLDQMREVVEEKLQKTLNERIGQSFELVSRQLESVQRGLGEMQTLAQDVGGLKKVLSNVKMRGGVGEVRLEMLLEQVLAPQQYEANVKTKKGSSEIVEFAIKLPGKDDDGGYVYLPIDAKFPQDIYHHLTEAYELADPDAIETASQNLDKTIRKMARDIHEKYIDPPYTTEFGILFLPFEGLYAEVIRRTNLMEILQRDYRIIITGPTTLAAILNSLQMGFKTLAIQKRSSEVWKVLGAIKTEFGKFGDLLGKAQRNLHLATNQLDELAGKRTKMIVSKLKQVESLPQEETSQYLPDAGLDMAAEEEDLPLES
jgi:DNA recombination protein RmuC